MKVKYKNQRTYEELIQKGDCDKLKTSVNCIIEESEGKSLIDNILALSAILEDEEMVEYVKKGLMTPVIGTLIKNTCKKMRDSLI